MLLNLESHLVNYYDENKENIFIMDIGVNDYGIILTQKTINNILIAVTIAIKNGYHPYVCTIAPASNATQNEAYWLVQYDNTLTLNQLIRDNAIEFGYKCIDVFNNPAWNYYEAPFNLTYYLLDHVHHTREGYNLKAQIIYDSITVH